MHGKITINRVMKQLKNPKSEYERGILNALKWVRKDIELEDLSPDLKPYKPYVPKALDSNRVQYWNQMPDPARPGFYYIERSVPENTLRTWWTKVESTKLPPPDKISFGNNYFQIPDANGAVSPFAPTSIHWEDIWVLHELYPHYFHSNPMTVGYIKALEIEDTETMLWLTHDERQALTEELGLRTRSVRGGLEAHLNANYIGRRRYADGKSDWVFRRVEDPSQSRLKPQPKEE